MARESVTVDQAYVESVGEFGPGQRWLWLLTSVIWSACSIQIYLMLFVEIDPFEQGWWQCLGVECVSRFTPEMTPDDTSRAVCDLPRGSWEWTQRTNSVVSEFNLICENAWKKDFADSVVFLGVLIGAGLFGFLSDKYGRRKAMYAATGIAGVSTLLSGLAPSYWLYLAFKLLTGIGFGGEGLSSFVLMTELIGPSWRGKAGIATQLFFPVGECTLAALAYLIRQWRQLTFVSSVITLSFFLTFSFIPESPKWLLVNGRKDEAVDILEALATANKTEMPEAPLKDAPGGPRESHMAKVLSHSRLRNYLTVMVYCWCIVSCIYYGIALSLESLPGSIYAKFFMTSFMEFPSYSLIASFVDRVGRKPIYTWGFVTGSAACLLIAVVPQGRAVILGAMVGKFAAAGVFNLSFLYTTELFPTVVRNATLGVASLAARAGGIVAPQIVFAGKAMNFASFPFLVFGITGLMAGGAACMLPETLGVHPPDTMEDVAYSAPSRSCKLITPGTWFMWKKAGKENRKLDVHVGTPSDEENLLTPLI